MDPQRKHDLYRRENLISYRLISYHKLSDAMGDCSIPILHKVTVLQQPIHFKLILYRQIEWANGCAHVYAMIMLPWWYVNRTGIIRCCYVLGTLPIACNIENHLTSSMRGCWGVTWWVSNIYCCWSIALIVLPVLFLNRIWMVHWWYAWGVSEVH